MSGAGENYTKLVFRTLTHAHMPYKKLNAPMLEGKFRFRASATLYLLKRFTCVCVCKERLKAFKKLDAKARQEKKDKRLLCLLARTAAAENVSISSAREIGN